MNSLHDGLDALNPGEGACGRLRVAIILDGNGRWATRRGLPRSAGHAAGAQAVRRTVEAAPALGIGSLTLYAFSADNWRRPREEVGALMSLFGQYLEAERARLVENGMRLTIIGRRDRLTDTLRHAIADVERATADGQRLALEIAVDYSARDAIAHAAARAAAGGIGSRDEFGRILAAEGRGAASDIYLLIRPGGEKRLSDFLLWEAAYAELYFVDTLWPDFGADDLARAIAEYRHRDRRFGGLSRDQRPAAAE